MVKVMVIFRDKEQKKSKLTLGEMNKSITLQAWRYVNFRSLPVRKDFFFQKFPFPEITIKMFHQFSLSSITLMPFSWIIDTCKK